MAENMARRIPNVYNTRTVSVQPLDSPLTHFRLIHTSIIGPSHGRRAKLS
ncbi:hypothetical protein WCLP8_3660008 [uncultured Gammaproteobacteria bacterium]